MLLCLCLGALSLLLGCSATADTNAAEIVAGIADACAAAARGVVEQELRSVHTLSGAEIRTAQQQTAQETLGGLQAILQEIWSGRCCQQEPAGAARQMPAPEECPLGWSRHEDSCYFVSLQKTTWYRAHYSCATLHRRARLASIHLASSEFIEALLTGDDYFWIGLVRLNPQGGFVWSDGSPLDYTKWRAGQPGSTDQPCVLVKADDKQWRDIKCDVDCYALCQLDLVC